MSDVAPWRDYSWLLGSRAKGVYEAFIQSLHLPGDVAECGVFAGETSRELIRYLEQMGIEKVVHLFDTFEGFPNLETFEEHTLALGNELEPGKYHSSLDTVLGHLDGLSRYRIHQGIFSDTFLRFSEALCFVDADADLYYSTVDIIRLADRCLVSGGRIVFDDFGDPQFPGVKWAIDRFLSPKEYLVQASSETTQCIATRMA